MVYSRREVIDKIQAAMASSSSSSFTSSPTKTIETSSNQSITEAVTMTTTASSSTASVGSDTTMVTKNVDRNVPTTTTTSDHKPRNYKKILEKRFKEQGLLPRADATAAAVERKQQQHRNTNNGQVEGYTSSSGNCLGDTSTTTTTTSGLDGTTSTEFCSNAIVSGIFRDCTNSTNNTNTTGGGDGTSIVFHENPNGTTGIAFPLNDIVRQRQIQRNLHPRRSSTGPFDSDCDDYTFNPVDAKIIDGNNSNRGNRNNNNNKGGKNSNINNNDDDDGFIDDLYAEYKADVAWKTRLKSFKRWRRFILTRLLPAIIVIICIILLVLRIKKKRHEYKLVHVPTMSPTTLVPSVSPTVSPPYTDIPTTYEVYASVRDLIHNKKYKVRERALTQISHYRNIGTGLIININILHQGDTALCGSIGKSPQIQNGTATPSFVCWKTTKDDKIPSDYPITVPWLYSMTDINIHIVRTKFHYIQWEMHSEHTPIPALIETDWLNPNLISILVIRHPLERMFYPDGQMGKKYPTIFTYNNASEQEWWDFANSTTTDNFQLRLLSGQTEQERNEHSLIPCCNGINTSRIHINTAKRLLRQITFIIDYKCLHKSITAIAGILNITTLGKFTIPDGRPGYNTTIQNVEQRINNYHIYKYLLQRNQLDIELYEWAKSRAIVDCTATTDSTT